MSRYSVLLKQAILNLHRGKDAAYGPAWKRRGEQISVLANIARKIDRLEWAMTGAPATADESVLDTCVDLFIYCVKYETFLADLDETVARTLFAGALPPPYSDGPSAVDWIVEHYWLSELPAARPVSEWAAEACACFEACFDDGRPTCPPIERWERAQSLRKQAMWLVLAVSSHSTLAVDFVESRLGATDAT